MPTIEIKELKSPNGNYRLVMQQDGNLVMINYDGHPIWATGTDGSGAIACFLQQDGNLTLNDKGGNIVWQTNTGGNKINNIVLQDDRNLVIYGEKGNIIWTSNTNIFTLDTIVHKQITRIQSTNGKFTLIMQWDGNLVLYNYDGKPIWATGTDGSGATTAYMQNDGNLVLYDSVGKAVWATGTDRNPAATLVLQDDRNLVIYSNKGISIWSSKTNIFVLDPSVHKEITKIQSPNGKYTLIMQGDGNLVLYIYDGKPIWASGTDGSGATTAYMQNDGNLVLYDSVGKAVWATGTDGNPGATLVLQDDRNLVIYDTKNKLRWQTNTTIYGIEQLDEITPILLMPLRIETRFASGGTELWVRIFPDEIAIHNHEDGLTESEIKGGEFYWKSLGNYWSKYYKNNLEQFKVEKKKNWSQIVNHFGANRAKWIIRQTKPNLLNKEDDFYAVVLNNNFSSNVGLPKNQAWTEAASCRVMPDYLKLQLYIGDANVYEMEGNPIPNSLALGPDPKDKTKTPALNPELDWTGTSIEWLQNFDKAVAVGMGFKVPLNKKTIPGYVDTVGFTRLMVLGIRTESSHHTDAAEIGKNALDKLFENHLYGAKGMAIISQGTPTNNTEETRSGLTEQTVFSEELYQQEFVDQNPFSGTSDDDKTDGQRLVEALAIDRDIFRTVENVHNTDAQEAVAMNKALYPATLGFYLENLLHPLFLEPLFSEGNLQELNDFFCSKVTGRGPLPTFRIGAQPYGVLPTSDFKNWNWIPDEKFAVLYQNLILLLKELDSDFQTFSKDVAALGKEDPSKKPHEVLDKILSLYPNSEVFLQRVGYSENFLRNYLGQLNGSTYRNPLIIDLLNKIIANINSMPSAHSLMQTLGLRINSVLNSSSEGVLQLSKIIFEQSVTTLDRSRLVDLLPASETSTLTLPEWMTSPDWKQRRLNYIQWLQTSYITNGGIYWNYFHKMSGSGTGTDTTLPTTFEEEITPPLLYLLLKHSFLLQLYKSAFQLLRSNLPPDVTLFSKNKPQDANFIAGKEFFNLFNEDITPFDLLQINNKGISSPLNKLSFLNNDQTLSQYLVAKGNRPEINNFITSLEKLGELTTSRLERIFVEHLDCLTYRLDAWQTGLFYQKLEANRGNGADKIYLGAFGWLENIKPKLSQAYKDITTLPAELKPSNGRPIIEADDIGGYIQAPSIAQAKAAALLRNGYLNYHDPDNATLMAIDLSSERVRKALNLFEGVQKGQHIEVLLGYRFERSLHDNMLDQYIPAFRKAFPFNAKTISNPDGTDNPKSPEDNIGKDISTVFKLLDGKALVDERENPTILNNISGLTEADKQKISASIDDLVDCTDAMKDLLVGESIYQLTQGNMDRAGAILQSIAELKPPPVFEFVNTPRTSEHLLTNRASILFNGSLNPVNPWPGIPMTPRANFEPGLNEWLGKIIGPPVNIDCTVWHTNPGKTASKEVSVSLENLLLQPIDIIYIISEKLESEESELSLRIKYCYRQLYSTDFEDGAFINIAYSKSSDTKLSLSEIFPLLSRLKGIITNAKTLNAEDFDLQQYPGKVNPKNFNFTKVKRDFIDIGNITERKEALKLELRMVLDDLSSNISAGNSNLTESNLIRFANLGIPSSIPHSVYANGSKNYFSDLQTQAQNIFIQGKIIFTELEKGQISFDDKDINTVLKQWTEKIQLLFGKSFKVLPRFHFKSQDGDDIDRLELISTAAEKESNIFNFIIGSPPVTSRESVIQHWINGVSRTRTKIENFEWVRTLYNAFQNAELELNILQLPYQEEDSWMGIEFPENVKLGKAKLSMLVHYQDIVQADWTGDFCGLLLDEWVEEIPGKEETTAITFQYDQPNSQPPQALLLAISPEDGGKWSWEKLLGILNDTLNRAKKRGVDTSQIASTDWASVLPAVISEFSSTRANVSLFFRDNLKN